MSNSWIHLKQQDEAHALDSSLSKADSFGARDCGWVEQMRPFIRDFSSPGHVVLDPFSGFASTLVAASLEGRQSIGFEIEEKRFELSKKRLADLGCRDTRLFQGDCNELVSKLDPVDLIISNIPYFGCNLQSDNHEQIYSSKTYKQYLERLRKTLKNLKRVLKSDSFIILMAENVRVGDHFVPQAWDIAKLLAERFNFIDERVIIYDKPSNSENKVLSNRSHEYVLIAQNIPKPINLNQSKDVVAHIQSFIPEAIVYGSFARWLVDKSESPSDVDIYLPYDHQLIARLLTWLDEQDFQLTRWGCPIDKISLPTVIAETNYIRAERLDANGNLILIDISFSTDRTEYENLLRQSVNVDAITCVIHPIQLKD